MENCVMNRGDKSELEVAFRSFKINAKGPDAIRAIRWPLGVVLLAAAAVMVIVALRSHPVDGILVLISHFRH
jgi:hypothetical protein